MKIEETKAFLKAFIWEGTDVHEFENWLFKKGLKEIEQLVGSEEYMRIVSYDYRRTSIEAVKRLIKEVLSQELIEEFEQFFRKKGRMIRGECIRNKALNHSGNQLIDWDVEIGKTYDIIVLIENSKDSENHKSLVNFVDKSDFFNPSGHVPMELFKIEENTISEYYHKYVNERNETVTEPVDWSKEVYVPTHYSFWKDFYNNDKKAEKTYFYTLEKLGIKNIW